MNFSRLSKLTIFVLVVLFTWTSGAYAGGGAAGEPCWVVDNPSGGAIALRATMAVVFTPADKTCDGLLPNVDAVIRVQRGSDMAFFRTNIKLNLDNNTDEAISGYLLNSCVYMDPESDNAIAADKLAGEILDYFIGTDRPEMELVITGKSISNTDYNGSDCVRAIPCAPGDTSCAIPPCAPDDIGCGCPSQGGLTGRAASIADITLYAVEK